MEYRTLGRTDWQVSTVSFGAWAIGGTWGAVDGGRVAGGAAPGPRPRRQLLRHRRRLRRRPLGAPAGAAAQGAQGPLLHRHQGGAAPPQADGRGLQQEEPDELGRPQPEEPGERSDRSPAASLPADRPLLPARGVRPLRRPGQGRQDPLLRRQRRAGRGGAQGDRVSGRAVGADHLQHLPPAPGRPLLRRGAQEEGRHPGAAAAIVGDAGRQDDPQEQVRRGRPPELQPRRRGVRSRRDLLRRPVLEGPGGRRRAAPAGPAKGPRWRRSRSAGS